jgi:hypothetical protein
MVAFRSVINSLSFEVQLNQSGAHSLGWVDIPQERVTFFFLVQKLIYFIYLQSLILISHQLIKQQSGSRAEPAWGPSSEPACLTVAFQQVWKVK